MDEEKPDLSEMADKWPSAFVAREEVSTFTGGAITPKYLAILDSQGKGVQGRIRIGRKIIYPVKKLVSWLELRSAFVKEADYGQPN